MFWVAQHKVEKDFKVNFLNAIKEVFQPKTQFSLREGHRSAVPTIAPELTIRFLKEYAYEDNGFLVGLYLLATIGIVPISHYAK